MKIEIIGTGMGPILSNKKLDEIFFGTSTTNRKSPLEEAMDKLLNEVKRDDEKKYKAPICFDIQSILANHKKGIFTVVWNDGTHTKITLQPGDTWDDEKALAMCFVKHLMGDTGSFNDIFTEDMPTKLKVIPKDEPKTATISVDTSRGTVVKMINCTVSSAVDRIDEVEKKVNNVENTIDDLKVAVKKAGIAAETASDNFAKLVDVFAGTSGSTPDPTEDVAKYKVYLYNIFWDDKALLAEGKKLIELPEFISAEQKKRIAYPGYTRYWSDKTGLYIDYGSHSYYFHIPGLTMEEYSKTLNNPN